MTLHTFKRQLKAYLFHIRCAGEHKEHPPSPGNVVVFFVILAPDKNLPTYLRVIKDTNRQTVMTRGGQLTPFSCHLNFS